ncbi:GH36-type glycosyl hydrolase domain-containing protein [Allochromatium vinosum]|uniref:GH36-type glycosyl hydrolase domain-containing protein n=1 Tax=Allochromatium vinosum TaxID=1049 RepID=UPI0019051813|nr:glycosyl transferase [Allochromatium vinosum]MBK1654547.1 glycosyl transferase [Allochromatium vinosum]
MQQFFDPHGPESSLHRLSNGSLEALISESGAGQLRWNGLALTRWHADPVEDDLGSLLYVRDLDSGAVWSLGYQPTRVEPRVYRVGCQDDRFRLEREDQGIALRLDLSLDATRDLERRCVRLTNVSDRARRIELTSYLEVVLFPSEADAAHPAFAKLFVQTERDASTGALLARRRPRGQGESWPWMIHALLGAEAVQWETDRARFIGRGRNRTRPAALFGSAPEAGSLSGRLGNVLDPILSLRTVIELQPGAGSELTWITGAAPDRAAALALLDGESLKTSVSASSLSTDDEAPASRDADDELAESTQDLRFFNGYGGFSADGRRYEIQLPYQGSAGHRRPPQPWINVIANPDFGCLVSESGAGYTWSRNSQANRLTPWFNDPVGDPHGEALYVRDEATGESWSPLPGPRPAPAGYRVTHGLGFTRFALQYAGLEQETTLFVPRHDPLRVLRLRLTNPGAGTRRLSLLGYQRLVMGQQPSSGSAIVTAIEPASGLLRAINPEAGDFAGGIVFATAIVSGGAVIERDFTTDRLSVIGRHRDLADPVALEPGRRLDGRQGTMRDPCFAQRLRVSLEPGATLVCDWLLGEAMSETQLGDLLQGYADPAAIGAAFDEAVAFWDDLVSHVQVETPEPAIDLMLNGWLLYQNLGCRIWARSAFYQSGGAYGYRDQLQDAAALAAIRPDITRAQILLHAAHQFVEGDVLHWWHPAPLERGLRTRFSDDLLWLPFVLAHYVRMTGDVGLLDEIQPYLAAPELAPGQDENYLTPVLSGESGDLYDHGCRAIDRSLTRGVHGLPLMGTGDWNDGMNRIGRAGHGESVWMGFFLYRVLSDFLPLCERRGDQARLDRYRAYQAELERALETSGWDGDWYRRAYYDDGTPLGSAADAECRIDALAQAWAALSGAVPRARAEQALDSLERHLASEPDRLIRLLTPPFVDTPHDPGYIKGYVAGVRENGGQYTHAACWAVAAMAELGRHEQAAPWLARLSPVSHTRTSADVRRYRLEPYVVAADVYGEPPHVGRGGWSWYTGSAGWWYRVALESVLGLRIENGRELVIRPCIPASWPGFRLRYRLPDGVTECEIQVDNGDGGGVVIAASLDDKPLTIRSGAARAVLPAGPGRHSIRVKLGASPVSAPTP